MSKRRRRPRGQHHTSTHDRTLEPVFITKAHAVGLAVLALVAVGISSYLTYVHYRIHNEPGWNSACAISDVVNCDAALTSRFGSIAGTPLAALGVWFYALTALIAIAAFRRGDFPRSPAIVLLSASGFASALSLALIAASATIEAICPLCAMLHLINFAMLALAWMSLRSTGEGLAQAFAAERKWWNKRATQAASVVAVAIVVLLALVLTFLSHPVTSSRLCDALTAVAATTASSAPAPLTVYLDFQCPHCQNLDQFLRTIRGSPNLRIIPRRHPQERECNPHMKRPGRLGSCLQARAAICAEQLGRYDDFSDRLFDGGPRDETGILSLGASVGLDPASLGRCMSAPETQDKLGAELEAATADGVHALPTLVFGEIRHVGALTDEDRACFSVFSRAR